MELLKEIERINESLKVSIPHLPAAYLLEGYNQLTQLWEDIKVTPEMESQLKKARRKSITADKIIKLNEVIIIFNEIEASKKIDDKFKESIIRTIQNTKKHIDFDSENAYHLVIEHDFEPNSSYAELFVQNIDETILEIKTDIDFSPYWGILETRQWRQLQDNFEGIMVKEQEVIQDFAYAFKLQSYLRFFKVLEGLRLFSPDNKILPKGMKITVGEHDCHKFEFVVK